MTKTSFFLVLAVIVAIVFFLIPGYQESVYTDTAKNYGDEVDQLAAQFNMPAEYFKALIILECSGKEDVPSRFEKHIYHRLKRLKQGKLKNYESLRQVDLKGASDEALRNLASSWGPFQLMGYKCKELGVEVKDIRGEEALYWGFYWIDKEYGDYVRQKRYAEAFRIHNTGHPSGKTANPTYVKEGLEHIEHFVTQRPVAME